jgi:riboflavin kinase / FMN adenylyltransferase
VQRWYGLEDVPAGWGQSVVTIGVFDGVHLGHQRIIARATEIAQARNLPVVVVTFDPHPAEVVRPGSHPPVLTSVRRRAGLLEELGADAVFVLPFTLEFSRMGPDEFVRIVLAERLHAAVVVVGENFRFGHKAAGDVPLLGSLGEKYDFTAEGVPLFVRDGGVSSSAIRERIAAGDVAGAALGLGRPHRVEGVVVRGHQRGRALGFPTANLETPAFTAIPADGVYAGWLARLDDDGSEAERWPAAISVGTNPTFIDVSERTVEAYALDRDDLDLYGVHAAIEFSQRLRGNVRFESVEALIEQMRRDVEAARTLVA